MEEKKFRYDAFISYRHTELDKFVAENLIKELESFKLPGNVAKKLKGKKTKIERVFRDREELPLTNNLEEPIVEALKSSEWLIVICSPRLPESVWCKKEIETFISLRGREHVLAVLIEGEPSESFPEELLYRIEEVETTEGTIEQVKVPVEPLAADFRGENKKAVAKAMKTEKLRILAAMFGIPFDDLRQRHRERRMRRIMGASLLVGTACLLFGIYSTITALRIKEQSEQIEVQSAQIIAQSDEILKQNEELKEKSEEIQKQNEAIIKQNDELSLRQAKALAESAERYLEAGDRSAAVQTAVEALTVSDGIQMPYTTQAQYILTESLRAYDVGGIYKAQFQYETPGRIDYVEESIDSDTLVLHDETGMLTLYDVEKHEVIDVIGTDQYDSLGEYGCTFLNADRFAYINVENQICIYDLQKKSVTSVIDNEYTSQILTDAEGKYLVAEGLGQFYRVYDGETLQCLGNTPSTNILYSQGPFISAEGILADLSYEEAEDGTKIIFLYFVDLNTMEIISSCKMDTKKPVDVEIRDGIAYVISSYSESEYMDFDTYTAAIRVSDGTMLWENVQRAKYADKIKLPGSMEEKYLLNVMQDCIQLLDMGTGEVIHTTTLTSAVVEANAYADNNNFLLFCENGEMLLLNQQLDLCADMSERFECNTTSNDYIFHSNHGITVLAHNDKMITIYTSQQGPDVMEVAQEMARPEEWNEISGDKAHEIARSYHLDKPEFVKTLYYSTDERYCFVHYWDYSFLIYDTVAGEVRSIMDWAYPTEWCLGTDAKGNTYLLGYYGAYMLNMDMEPIAWISKARDIDLEAQKAYITYGNYNYEVPLYDLEELLQMAETLGYTSK